jgi:hypothetical protein
MADVIEGPRSPCLGLLGGYIIRRFAKRVKIKWARIF